ncbi:antibiotic biosynthesis monooxygenase family protein [Vibrio nomapromontoriensis]|uniref:antibiotic biosynthesis monooxygenase family protein n=1 Tax=Vibrio nomapromontoriensis TaxID=2910246 RepID=UPI003D12FDD2
MTIHVFFNVIILPEGDDKNALSTWASIGEFMEQQPGFLGSTLFRNRQNPKMLINKGRYESEESFLACIANDEFQKLSKILNDLGVERTAALYDKYASFGQGSDEILTLDFTHY